jgi:2-methylisocitrate lyase-like PEP mutase family enzyme
MASSLRKAISAGPMVLAPGAYDALTARLVALFGFPTVYITGADTSMAHGSPHYGLLTMTEMAGATPLQEVATSGWPRTPPPNPAARPA